MMETGRKNMQGWAGWLAVSLAGLLFILACNLPFIPAASGEPLSFPGPSVTIQQPANGTQVAQGASFLFFASANDPLGVVRLDLWVDDTLVLSQASPDANGFSPLSLSYSLVAARSGTYALVARAYNSRGEFNESVVHYVSVVEQLASRQEYAQYVVQAGDTLENIAARLGISVDDILRANPHIAGGQLQPGQVILIPKPKSQPPQAAIPGPNGVQPIAVGPGGLQPGGGAPPVAPQQKPAPPPQNPSPQIVFKSANFSANPVYYGANCQAKPTRLSVAAVIEPAASVSKVVLAYAFIDAAGLRSQDLEISMQLTGAEYKADVEIGQEAGNYLAQADGQVELRIEAHDSANRVSVSPLYTLAVHFCAPTPFPPPPGNQPSLSIKNLAFPSTPIYYGQACTTEPLTANVVATLEPPGAVRTATLKYYYTGPFGSSGIRVLQMAALGGADFGATINASVDAELHLSQQGGTITLWVEVVDTSGQTSISQPATLTVNFCVPPGAPPPNLLPGILPEFRPGAIPSQEPIAQLDPSLFPDPMVIFRPPNTAPTDPLTLKAVASGECQVSLTWNAVANATGYQVNRIKPGLPKAQTIASLSASDIQYMDKVPSSSRYGYTVVAVKLEGGRTTPLAISPHAWVDARPSTRCQVSSDPKRLFFHPQSFTPYVNGVQNGTLWVTLDSFTAIRVPRNASSLPAGDWSADGEWGIPMPETLQLGPGQTLTVEVRGSSPQPTGVLDLGGFQNVHTYESLVDPAARTMNWSAGQAGADFDLTYRLWLEDWLWGSNIVDPLLASPYNVKLYPNTSGQHFVRWDYDQTAKMSVVGFAVYAEYNCSGSATARREHHVVLVNPTVKGPVNNDYADQMIAISLDKEPPGCFCSYRVSAFSSTGESSLSQSTTEECKTNTPTDSVQVTFESLSINHKATSGVLTVFANQVTRESADYAWEAKPYALADIPLNGKFGQNVVIVPMEAGKTLGVHLNFNIPGLCTGDSLFIPKPSFENWKAAEGQYTLTSSDKNCELRISLLGRSSWGWPGESTGGALIADGSPCVANKECASGECSSNVCMPTGMGMAGAFCLANSHCWSGVCQCVINGVTTFCPGRPAPGTTGACAAGAANGMFCTQNNQCASFHCANGLCAPLDKMGRPGDYCHHDNHCWNGLCICPQGWGGLDGHFCKGYENFENSGVCSVGAGLPDGQACEADSWCRSNHCAEKVCVPSNGAGLAGDYCHHNDHCYSGNCACNDKDIFGLCWDKGGGSCAP